jgi:hypothetical protein
VHSNRIRSVFEIVLRIQIGDQSGLNWAPSQPLPGLRAGSRTIDTKKVADPAKMIRCFLARLADDRYVQMPADDLSDLSSRNALVGHAVIRRAGGSFLKRKPVEMRSIEPMHRWPAVEPVAYICGNALFTCDANQAWHEAVITVAVDRWRKPQNRGSDSACRQCKRRILRLAREVGVAHIVFGCERAPPLNEQGPASDDQRAIRTYERAAKSLDGASVCLCGRPVV